MYMMDNQTYQMLKMIQLLFMQDGKLELVIIQIIK